MSIAGELCLRVDWNGETVERVDIRSSRPLAAQTLVSRRAPEVLKLVPMLFSICGHAQQVAAAAAMDAASDRPADSEETGRRCRRVHLEAVQEHLWRIMLDWPAMLGVPQMRERFATWYRRCASARAETDEAVCRELAVDLLQYLDRSFLPLPLDQWQGLDRFDADEAFLPAREITPLLRALAELEPPGCQGGTGNPAPDLLPEMSARELADAVPQSELASFCRAPTWAGRPCETGALAARADQMRLRRLLDAGRRVFARFVARVDALIDDATVLAAPGDRRAPIAVDDHRIDAGIGLARVITARGVLIHRVEMQDDVVRNYAVVAPTEWNFHPMGVVATELAGRRFESQEKMLQRVRATVLALDPCVGYRIDLGHA